MHKINSNMFKSYDIRTKECNLTNAVKNRLADSIAVYLKKINIKSVVICRDTRLYVPQLAEIVEEKLVEAGFNVFLNPIPISSCQFYFTCMQHKKSAGLMFTASHNPGEYTGIKLVAQDLVPISMTSGPEGGLKTVKKIYEKGTKVEPCTKCGKLTIVNELDSYIDYSMHLAGVKEGSLKGLNVMFEFLNGSAGFEEALAFQKAGANVTFRHIIPNGLFPCGDPNPIVESSIAPARKAMKKGKFDLGFCFDGDGDRMDIMDCNGNQIIPSHNMSIIAPHIKEEIFKGAKSNIYTDVKTIPSSLIEIANAGITPHTTRNGHSFIKAKLKENIKNGYFAAVEESAHYYMCFPYSLEKTSRPSDFAVTESTLFYALLTARCYKENPKLYKPTEKVTVFREREWSIHADKNPKAMDYVLKDIKKTMLAKGAFLTNTMDDGTDLDAFLYRWNLPKTFKNDTNIEKKTWFQIVARISRSEDALLRIEVSSNSKKLCKAIKEEITNIALAYKLQ